MQSMKEILAKYPELRRPGPRYWVIPATLVIVAVLGWSSQDTEMLRVVREDNGSLALEAPDYQWDFASNILMGPLRPLTRMVDGVRVPVTRMVDGQEIPVLRRQGGLVRPDLSRRTISRVIPDMLETIEMALLGTLIATIIALPLSFLAARNIVGSSPAGIAAYGVVRFIFNFLSAIPALVVAMLFTVIVGVGPAAGVLALGFHSIGMMGRLFAEALEGVDRGPIEALQASGAGRIQTAVYAVIPQIGPLFLAYSIYRWDINVRMSMILGFVGAGGIGVFLQGNLSSFNYTQVSTAFLLILVTVTLIDLGSSWLQRRLI